MSPSRIWTAGFNAFHQLSNGDGDIWTFEPLMTENSASASTNNINTELLYASWSSTAIRHGSRLHSRGFQNFDTECSALTEGFTLQSPFGDHNGLIGCLDSEGRVFYLTACEGSGGRSAPLVCPSGREAPPLSYVAVAGNERVAVAFKQAPNARLTHIAEFTSFASFVKWHADPSNEAHYPASHHMLPGRPKQLLANAANFILCMEEGEVYTWGDPRFRTLARPTVGADAVPADKPGLVDALGGLKIASVQCGPGVGWMASALSEDGALYLWGTTMPGDETGGIKCLQDAGAGEVALVDIVTEHGSEPTDIVSIGIGRNHIAVVTDAGELFVAGDNSNGQLGLGKEQSFVEDWAQVPFPGTLQGVIAAPKATFAFAN
ncbi:hypothetical protein Q7P37_003663 [Cladosporium fusiforme]